MDEVWRVVPWAIEKCGMCCRKVKINTPFEDAPASEKAVFCTPIMRGY